jgi:HlyD family secretion protein
MIKNWWWLSLVGSTGLGCAALAEGPEVFQGVVEHEEQILGFETGGRLSGVAVRRGDVVGPGQLLATLDDTLARGAEASRTAEAQAAAAQAKVVRAGSRIEDRRVVEAQIRAAQAKEQLLLRQVERERGLLLAGAIPAAAFDELEAKATAATAEREALMERLRDLEKGARPEEIENVEARASAAQLAADLERTRVERLTLQAPRAGEVVELHADPGEVVGPGTPVVTVADTLHPYVEVFVPQNRLAGLRLGTPAEVKVDARASALPGTIERIGRRTEFTPRYLFSEKERAALVVRVRVRVEDPQRLLYAGVPAFVRFEEGGVAEAGR